MPEKKQVSVTPNQLIESYRLDQQRMGVLERRQNEVQRILNEMVVSSEALKELQKAEKDNPVMVSLGAGFYAQAKIEKVKTVKSSLAGFVLVESSAKDAVSKLEQEIEKAKKELSALLTEKQKIAQNMRGIASIIEQGREAARNARQSQDTGEVSSVS